MIKCSGITLFAGLKRTVMFVSYMFLLRGLLNRNEFDLGSHIRKFVQR